MSDVKHCVVTLGLHFISGDGQIRFVFSGIFLTPEAKGSNTLMLPSFLLLYLIFVSVTLMMCFCFMFVFDINAAFVLLSV